MTKLRNPTIEKLVAEGKISSRAGPNLTEKNRELYYKQKIFECANYKTGYNSRRRILTNQLNKNNFKPKISN
jgi:hypothetical protein